MSFLEDYDYLHINNLPDGLLESILEYLPLNDRKTASLVCTQWNYQAFSRRSMARVKLRVSCIMMNQKEKSLEVLEQSWRPYRHLLVSLCGSGSCSEVQFAFVVAVLRKFGTSTDSFTILRGCSSGQLREFVGLLPNLKQLRAFITEDTDGDEVEGGHEVECPVLLKLTELDLEITNDQVLEESQLNMLRMAPNVRKLNIVLDKCENPTRAFEALQRYGPQLKSLDIFTPHSRVPIDSMRFRQLEKLKLRGRMYTYSDDKLRKLFSGLPQLKEAHLDFVLSRSVLEILCLSCPRLTTLEIKTENLDDNSFQYLENLKELKIMIVNYMRINLIEKCTPLTSVHTIHFHTNETHLYDERFVDLFHQVFPNLQTLKIYFRGFRNKIVDKRLVRRICQKFTHLKRLALSGEYCLSATITGFENPGDFGSLEELSLIRANLHLDAPIPNGLRRLKLEYMEPMTTNLLQFGTLFPQLKYLEVKSCRQVTPGLMADVRLSMPDCVVHYVQMERKWIYY